MNVISNAAQAAKCTNFLIPSVLIGQKHTLRARELIYRTPRNLSSSISLEVYQIYTRLVRIWLNCSKYLMRERRNRTGITGRRLPWSGRRETRGEEINIETGQRNQIARGK